MTKQLLYSIFLIFLFVNKNASAQKREAVGTIVSQDRLRNTDNVSVYLSCCDSTIAYDYWGHWNKDTLWGVNGKYVDYTYDSKNRLTSFILQKNNNRVLYNDNVYRKKYNYNEDNLLSAVYYQRWNGKGWHDSVSITYTYNKYNQRTQKITKSKFKNKMLRTVYSYNSNNQMIERDYKIKDNQNAPWKIKEKYIFDYDEMGNNISKHFWNNKYECRFDKHGNKINYLQMRKIGSQWIAEKENKYEYNTNGLLANENKYQYLKNGIRNTQYGQLQYAYDNNYNLLSTTARKWFDTAWTKLGRKVYTYDSMHNKLSEIPQSITSRQARLQQYRYKYIYDSLHNILESTQEECSSRYKTKCIFISKQKSYFKTHLISIATDTENQLKIFSKPFSLPTILKFKKPVRNATFTLLNSRGVVLYSRSNNYGKYFELNNYMFSNSNTIRFFNGKYFLEVKEGESLWRGEVYVLETGRD